MNDIVRKETNERLSRIVIHGEIVYIAGVTSTAEGGIAARTRDVLAPSNMRVEIIVTAAAQPAYVSGPTSES